MQNHFLHPWILNLKFSKDIVDPLSPEDTTTYRRIIGRLLYLQISRPDICCAVHKLSQFLQAPTSAHLIATHHLLKYIKGTSCQGVMLKPTTSFQLRAFVDADWATCLNTRRSVPGFCIFLGNRLISWKSKKQLTVSRSSAEAEYRGVALATSELILLTQVLRDLNVPSLTPAVVYCDNQAAIAIAHNPTFHERTKHIKIDCHCVRDKIVDGFLKLLPVRSAFQLANMFTKDLPSKSLLSVLLKLGIPNLGGVLE